MKKIQNRHGADSTGQTISFVQRVFGLLWASVAVWTIGYSSSALAGALKQAWVEEIQVLDAHGNVLTQPVTLKHLQKASARCKFEFLAASGTPAQVTPFPVMVNVNQYWEKTQMSNVWDPHIKTDGVIGYGYATFPLNTTGVINKIPDFGRNDIMCIAGGTRKMFIYTLLAPEEKKVQRPPVHLAINHRLVGEAKHGLAKMPNAHIRKCPTSVKATSTIDPHAFLAPFGTASKATNIPAGHLMLYLDETQAINDSLFCTYATRAGNARSTVEIACKGAHLQDKASHAYYCQ